MKAPRYCCKVGLKIDDLELDRAELGFYRDKMGNVTVSFWKWGKGFTELSKPTIKDLKKLRDWLTKLIDFVERP